MEIIINQILEKEINLSNPRCKNNKKEIPSKLVEFFPEDTYKNKGFYWNGRVTKTPWITIIDKRCCEVCKTRCISCYAFLQDFG